MSQEILVFEIDEGVFAVPTVAVREVLRAAAIFPLPEYPELVEGGLDLRGEIVPVVDGRAILRREGKPISPADHMIVIGSPTHSIAIHVDRALALTEISEDAIFGRADTGKFVALVVNSDYGPTTILNVGALIAACHPGVSTSDAQS